MNKSLGLIWPSKNPVTFGKTGDKQLHSPWMPIYLHPDKNVFKIRCTWQGLQVFYKQKEFRTGTKDICHNIKETDTFKKYSNLFILEREKGRERERNISLLFYLFMHSWVDSCMCPDQALNLQP